MTEVVPMRLFILGATGRTGRALLAQAGSRRCGSALGPPGLGRTTVLRDGARSTVAAMHAEGVRRLLVVSMGALFQDAGILAALLRSTVLRSAFNFSLNKEMRGTLRILVYPIGSE